MDSIKKLWVALIAVAIIALGGYAFPVVKASFGAISPSDAHATNWNEGTFSEGLAVGSSQQFQVSAAGVMTLGANSKAKSIFTAGTCNLWVGGNTTIAASTTVAFDCQAGTVSTSTLSDIPQFAVGDVVLMTAPTTTTQTFLGLKINAVSASSTAGYIRVQLTNETGGTYTIASSSMNAYQYVFIR